VTYELVAAVQVDLRLAEFIPNARRIGRFVF